MTILIAEDEYLNFIYLQELLEDYNCTIVHVENGRDAVAAVKENKEIDLVLIDVKMPIMNGFQAVREIRKTNINIPIVAQTAFTMSEDRKMAKEVGCNDYLSKPLSPEKLIGILNKYALKRDPSQ